VKITYFNKRKIEKRVRGVILGQKFTLNHPSLMDKREEIRIFLTAHKREKKEKILLSFVLMQLTYKLGINNFDGVI